MSNSIDERIVQMQFDNKKFEDGVAESLKTLEKLKGATDFKASKKSFNELEDAAKRLNFSNLESSVKSLTDRFSTLGIVGMTALQNITNKAVDAGERLIKSLTIDQISSGWDKYADKTSAVQTIMAATAKDFSDTGEQMAYVNEQLGKLNWFTDETSYSFLDMVSNIGKFTSNAVALDTSVTAMQGISTWAAISGANVNEASRAMYNLAQAISVGSVKLIDWKSIENANMATAEFKETVIDTALELGTLTKAADGTIKTLSGKDVSITDFNSQLSEGWFSSDVLLKTLDKYGAFTDRLYEITESTGTTATEFLGYIDDYQNGTIDLVTIAKKLGIRAEDLSGYLEELTDDTYALGLKSFKAAQEAKTFGEAISSVKDAVSTGWMNTFELIFGDYTEAKKLWTDLANSLWDIFAAGGEARNELLEGWRSIKRVKDGYQRSWNLDEYTLNEYGQYVRNFSDAIEELDGRTVLIEGVINAFSALLSIGSAVKYAFRSIFPEMTSERLYELTENFRDFTKNLKTYLSFNSDLVETADDQTEAYRGMSKPLEYLVRTMRGVFAAGKILINTFKAISGAIWKFVWGNKSVLNPIGEFFANFGDKIVEFSENLDSTDWYNTKLGDLSSIFNTISDAAQKGWARLQEFWNLLSTKFQESGIWPKIQAGFSRFTSYIQEKFPDAIDTLGGFFSDILDWVEDSGLLDAAFQKISEAVSWLSEKIPAAWQTVRGFFVGMWDYLRNNETLQSWVNTASDIWQGFVDKITGFVQKIREVIASIFSSKETPGGKGPKRGNEVFFGIEDAFDESKLNPFEQFLEKLQTLRENFETNWNNISEFFTNLKNNLSSGWDWVVQKFSDGSMLTALKNIAIALGAFFGVKTIWNFSNIGNKIKKGLEAIGDGLKNFGKGEQKSGDTIGTTVLKIAGAIAILAASVAVLTFMDPAKLERSFEIIKTLGIGLGVLVASLSVINDETRNSVGKIGNSIVKIALGVLSLVAAIWLLNKIDWETFKDGLGKLFLILIELATFEVAVRKLGGNGKSSQTDFIKLGVAVLLLTASLKWLSNTPFLQMLKGALGLGLVLGALALALDKINSKKFSKVGTGKIIALTLAVVALSSVFKSLGKLSWGQVGRGVLAMSIVVGSMVALLLAFKQIQDVKISKNSIAALAGVLVTLGLSLFMFVKTIKALEGYSGPDILRTMGGFAAMIAAIGVTTALLGGVIGKLGPGGFKRVALGAFALALSEFVQVGVVALLGVVNDITGGQLVAKLNSGAEVLKALKTAMDPYSGADGIIASWSTLGQQLVLGAGNGTLGVAALKGNLLKDLSILMDFITVELIGWIDGWFGGEGKNPSDTLNRGASALTTIKGALENFYGVSSDFTIGEAVEKTGVAGFNLITAVADTVEYLLADISVLIGGGVLALIGASEGFVEDIGRGRKAVEDIGGAIGGFFGAVQGSYQGKRLEEFSGSFSTFGSNLNDFASGLGEFDANKGLVQDAINIGEVLSELEKSLAPQGGVWQFLTGEQNLGTFGTKLGEFGTGLNTFATSLDDNAISNVGSVISAVESLIGIAEKGDSTNFGGLTYIAMELEAIAGAAFTAFVAPFQDPEGEMKANGTAAIDNFISGITDKGTDLVTIAGAVVSTVEGQVKPIEGKMKTIGENAIAGYLNGLKSRLNQVKSVASQIAAITTSVTANTLKVKSPSRAMYEIGGYVVEGYTNALRDGLVSVSDISQDLGDESILSLQDALMQLNSLIEDGVDVQPTITPIFDMSNLGDAAKAVDDAFYPGNYSMNMASIPALQRSVQTVAKNGSAVNQTYDNSEVVAAVNRLGSEIKGLKIVLDTGATVGGLSSAMDQKLGQRAVYRSRGN